MAKDKSELKAEKKKKSSPTLGDAGVSKSKSDKKDKKEKKSKREALAEKALNEVADTPKAKAADDSDVEDSEKKTSTNDIKPIGALVPFANPLADEKVGKKVFKSVKKGK